MAAPRAGSNQEARLQGSEGPLALNTSSPSLSAPQGNLQLCPTIPDAAKKWVSRITGSPFDFRTVSSMEVPRTFRPPG